MRKVITVFKKVARKPVAILVKIYRLLTPPIIKYIKNKGFRERARYGYYIDKYSIDDHTILYESYHGRNISCNPYAIYKELITNPKYSNFKHIWVIDTLENPFIEKVKNQNNTRVVIRHSKKYFKAIAKAKYLINNTSFGFFFEKKRNQIYINTWHGTPLKKIGADVEGAGFTQHKNIQKNLLHTDYFITPNKFTEESFLNSLHIRNIFNGQVIDVGYPRIDLTLANNRQEFKSELNVDFAKKIILYAPTWRGSSVGNSEDVSEQLIADVNAIQEQLGDEYVVLLKVHMFIYKYFEEQDLTHLCVPNSVDTNELLSIVDILITDYSSIFYDFLPTKKPVLFFMYDRTDYEATRGFYTELTDLPGPICENRNELISWLKRPKELKDKFEINYKKNLEKFNYRDDGLATKRVIDIIFNGKNLNGVYKTVTNKKKVLVYAGGFYNNGITASAINLSKYIDYDKYDLTYVDFGNKKGESIANLKRLDPRARVVYRVGAMNMRLTEHYKQYFVLRKGLYKKWVRKIAPKNLYRKEYNKIVGNSNFDIVIDFGGYNAFWALILAHSLNTKKSIFLHSDMHEEYNKIINGKRKHKKNLRVIFSLYGLYDRVVSVAKSAHLENYKNLSEFIENADEKMIYVNNSVDYLGVLEQKNNVEIQVLNEEDFVSVKSTYDSGRVEFSGVLKPKESDVNFVTMGRLSPEKDHEKLIKAFYKLKRANPGHAIKLYIIGSGPLRSYLGTLVNSLNLDNDIIFTGHLNYPFALIELCDCMVFSSNYEGQGLVVLESLILEKPVIATDVTGVRSILENGYGQLVENSVSGLYYGMHQYLNQGLQYRKFDYRAYNNEAMEMYYNKIFNC